MSTNDPNIADEFDSVFKEQQSLSSAVKLLDNVFALVGQFNEELDTLIPNPQPWVLCVDDDAELLSVLSIRLKARGISVVNAKDGLDAMHKVFTQAPDAIILDYNMPNGSGDEVLRRLKETPATSNIPVIVLTGNKNDSLRSTMLQLGAQTVLYKPVAFDDLMNELNVGICLAN